MAALLLDENVPMSTGWALAAAGHDIARVADVAPMAEDRQVLALARQQERILVTFDADFGELIYQQGEAAPPAVVYLRLHPIDGTVAATLVLQALADGVVGQLVVCTAQARRRRALPGSNNG